jgi:hypothetical protein
MCIIISQSFCKKLEIFGALVFMLCIFVHTCQNFMPLFMLYSIRGLICNPYFCTDGVATLLQYQRERYDLYGRPLVGGFSPHFVGDSQ